MGLFKSSAPKPPDYSKIAAASEKAAQLSFDIASEQLAWAKEQYASDLEITTPVINAALERMQLNDEWAQEDRARYKDTFQPLEDSLVEDAQTYDTDARKDLEAGRDQAMVAQNFEKARQASERQLESYGINPASVRFGGLDAGVRASQAAAVAAAGNEARRGVEDRADRYREQAINIGRGLPGQANAATGQAGAQGGAAANTTLAGTASGASTMGTGVQWTQSGQNALNNWGNTLSQGYSNQLSQFNANQNSSSGIGAVLGAVAPAAIAAFEDGGVVPPEASPSRGKAIDDVPAMLSEGEFVIPQAVLQWKGEEFFQKLVEGSKAKMAERQPAEPRMAVPA